MESIECAQSSTGVNPVDYMARNETKPIIVGRSKYDTFGEEGNEFFTFNSVCMLAGFPPAVFNDLFLSEKFDTFIIGRYTVCSVCFMGNSRQSHLNAVYNVRQLLSF